MPEGPRPSTIRPFARTPPSARVQRRRRQEAWSSTGRRSRTRPRTADDREVPVRARAPTGIAPAVPECPCPPDRTAPGQATLPLRVSSTGRGDREGRASRRGRKCARRRGEWTSAPRVRRRRCSPTMPPGWSRERQRRARRPGRRQRGLGRRGRRSIAAVVAPPSRGSPPALGRDGRGHVDGHGGPAPIGDAARPPICSVRRLLANEPLSPLPPPSTRRRDRRDGDRAVRRP